MPNDFEILEELRDVHRQVGLDEDYIDRLQAAIAASPIRKERDEYRKQAEAALERANTYRSQLLSDVFAKVGIKGKPTAYNVPSDLDPDEDKVREWAVSTGLHDPPEPESQPELDAHDRISAAQQGAAAARSGVITPDVAAEWDAAKWHRFEKQYPVEADSLMQGQQVTGITF